MVYEVIAQLDLSKLESFLHDSYRDKYFVLNTYQNRESAERYAQAQRNAIAVTNLLLESISVVEVDKEFEFSNPDLVNLIFP